jgi:hypothetical protein
MWGNLPASPSQVSPPVRLRPQQFEKKPLLFFFPRPRARCAHGSYLPICHYQIRVSPKYHHKNGFRRYAIFNHCLTDKMPFYPFSTLRETFILGKITTLSSHRESSHFDQPPAPPSPCPAAAQSLPPPPPPPPPRSCRRRRLGHPGLAPAAA